MPIDERRPGSRGRRALIIGGVTISIAVTVTFALHVALGGSPAHARQVSGSTPFGNLKSTPAPSRTTPAPSRTQTPPPSTRLSYAQLIALLPRHAQSTCHSESASVNTALGETAIAKCRVAGFPVTYTAYTTASKATNQFNALGGGYPSQGACTTQANGITPGRVYLNYSFSGGIAGRQYCNYNDFGSFADSTIGRTTMAWINRDWPLVVGVMTDGAGVSWPTTYSRWKAVINTE